jgi:SAM-dependent methyltransferase
MSSGVHDDAARYYEGRPPYSPKMAARLAGALKFDGSTRILELACGNGSLSKVIVPHVGHITGLDLSAGMLAVAFKDPKIRYVQWDFNRQPTYREDRRFHHILIGRALHWLSFQRLLDTFRESVEPGGSLVVCNSTFERSEWYVAFRHLLQDYGRLGLNPGRKALEALPAIGFRPQGVITERFPVTLSPDLLLQLALSFQPVTKAIEANAAEFKSRAEALLDPLMKDGAATATCLTTAHAWTR